MLATAPYVLYGRVQTEEPAVPQTSAPIAPTAPLLTPAEAAQRLLEAAALAAWRSNGHAGLTPVHEGEVIRYRQQDVDAFIAARLLAA